MGEVFLKSQVIFSQLHVSEKVLRSPAHMWEGRHLDCRRYEDWAFLRAPHPIGARTGLFFMHPITYVKDWPFLCAPHPVSKAHDLYQA